MDIDKPFDILDHTFLILLLKKSSFGQNFINWIETLLKDQESCIINGGGATLYFALQRGACQGDPILSLEIFSLSTKNIQRFNELQYLIIVISILRMPMTLNLSWKTRILSDWLSKTFEIFSQFNGLKPNISRYNKSSQRDSNGNLWYEKHRFNYWFHKHCWHLLFLQPKNKRRTKSFTYYFKYSEVT